MEDDLSWKTIFNGRQPFMEEDLSWKKNFHGRCPFKEDDLFFCFLLINKAFSVVSNWIYSPFNNLTFAQPYLERTFTWNSSVAQLSLACFYTS